MFKRPFVILALISMGTLMGLKADTIVKYPPSDPIIAMRFPEDWKMLTKKEGFVRMSSPREEIYIDVWLLKDATDPNDVYTVNDVIAELNTWCDDVHYTRNTSVDYTLNGMQMFGYTGSGVLKNEKASAHGVQNFYGHIFNPDPNSKFMVVTIRDQAAPAETWKETIKEIIKSIHLVNQ